MTKKLIGNVSVDSGQVIIVDPCYVLDDKKYELTTEVTLSKAQQGEVLLSGIGGFGVASSTATGDGSYPVYAEYTKRGEIKSLTIEFDTWED